MKLRLRPRAAHSYILYYYKCRDRKSKKVDSYLLTRRVADLAILVELSFVLLQNANPVQLLVHVCEVDRLVNE